MPAPFVSCASGSAPSAVDDESSLVPSSVKPFVGGIAPPDAGVEAAADDGSRFATGGGTTRVVGAAGTVVGDEAVVVSVTVPTLPLCDEETGGFPVVIKEVVVRGVAVVPKVVVRGVAVVPKVVVRGVAVVPKVVVARGVVGVPKVVVDVLSDVVAAGNELVGRCLKVSTMGMMAP